MSHSSSILQDQINLQKLSSHVYTVSWHADWTIGFVLHGGCIAAAIHHAATTHLATEPALVARNQPDLLTLHFEFLRPCEARESTITVTDLKIGARASTLQLQLSQNGKTKVLALATSTNMDSPGPTVATAWHLRPPPAPTPDFEAVLAHKPDAHWLPGHLTSEVFPLTRRFLYLYPREGFPIKSITDAWSSFQDDERVDAACLTMMTDVVGSTSDTLLQNGGLYDTNRWFALIESWAREHPGIPCELTNSLQEAMQATEYNNTVTLDIEFKRRLPKEGLQWIFQRGESRMLENGRMDLEVTICDQDMNLLCIGRQTILVLEAGRKFKPRKGNAAL